MQTPPQKATAGLPSSLPGFTHINRYWDKSNQTYAAKILPGQYYVTTHDEMIVTVLGSCVSACIRDTVFGIGGMNHFMLPAGTEKSGNGSPGSLLHAETRYGNYAMERLINDILKHGGHRQHLEVKIFGGGRIMAEMTDIGQRNIAFVREYLRIENLLLLAEDVGDIYPRRVHYFPASGKARMKKLRSMHGDAVRRREETYRHELEEQPTDGGVELF